MKSIALALALLPLLLASLIAQSFTLPPGLESTPTGTTTSYPFSQTNDQKWQLHYDSSAFVGITGPILITEISMRASNPANTVNAFDFSSVRITMSDATTDFTTTSHDVLFAANLSSRATVVRDGPFVGGPIAASNGTVGVAIPLQLDRGFVYDPSQGADLIIQIEQCGVNADFGTTLEALVGSASTVLGNRYGHLSSCTASSSTFNNSYAVPVVIIDYTDAPYQPNGDKASLDHNGVATDGILPGVTFVDGGSLVTANVSTSLLGAPHEFALALGGPTPLGATGAVRLGGGQILNLDLMAPGSVFLWGGVVPSFIPASNFSLPFAAPGGPVQWTAQGIYFDISSPSLLQLSSASSVLVRAPGASITAEASGNNSFNSDPATGFWKITNNSTTTRITSVSFDFSTSTNSSHANAIFDTDQTGMASRFDGGNSVVLGCEGTYRNSSDIVCGLLYDAVNTVPANPCDPAANTGWIGANPQGTIGNYRTLSFRFSSFDPGDRFEFDCDTDGGSGITGDQMDGVIVTITTDNAGTFTGPLTANPPTPGLARSSITF